MRIIAAIALLGGIFFTVHAQDPGAPLRNADVMRLFKAELPASTIILMIESKPTQFDTSPDAVIQLKQAGIPPAVIEAMLRAGTRTPPAPPWGTKQTRIEFDRVFLVDDGNRTEMKFSRPGMRTRAFTTGQQFAVLGGPRARLRTTNTAPLFEMILPSNIEVSGMVALAELGVRGNGTREIIFGHAQSRTPGMMGIPRERSIPLTYVKSPDQSAAPEGFEIYRFNGTRPLVPGEYALIVTSIAPLTGGSIANFYEFGVD